MVSPKNNFTDGPLGAIYVKTALPIILVMGVSGLLSVVDALFLGHYVGPEALAAVTLVFPAFMMIYALSTLVATGMSSLLARHLGGSRFDAARGVFAGAHGLAIVVGVVLIALFVVFGQGFVSLASGGNAQLIEMGMLYLGINVFFAPVLFILAINSDALRNEGRVGFMAAMSLLVSFANIGFNYVLIAQMQMGVAGSAFGTVLAQLLAFVIILVFRIRGQTILRPQTVYQHFNISSWGSILALGAPQSLNFIGIALGSGAIMGCLQVVSGPTYETTVSAYGIITRLLTFAFLPLLGMTHAMQTITGNNYGSAQWARSDHSVRIAIGVAFAYCVLVQFLLTYFARSIGFAFVDDIGVVSEVERILPIVVAVFFLSGPLIMISSYFQAIGDPGRAAILGLSKTYLFAIPLTFILAFVVGETGIWLAGPLAEILLLILTVIVLAQTAKRTSLRWGLFKDGARAA